MPCLLGTAALGALLSILSQRLPVWVSYSCKSLKYTVLFSLSILNSAPQGHAEISLLALGLRMLKVGRHGAGEGKNGFNCKMCASHESIHCELSAGTLPTAMEQMHSLVREICAGHTPDTGSTAPLQSQLLASSLDKPPLSPSPSALATCNHTLRSV